MKLLGKHLLLFSLLLAFIGLSAPAPGQIPSFIPTSGLRAWYPFSGNANDSSGYARHGIAYDGITYGRDRFNNHGHALRGNANSAVDIPDHIFPLGDSSRTVAVYFRLDSLYPGGQRQLMAWGNNTLGGRFGLITTDTSIGMEYAGASVTTHYFRDTFWHTLIVTYATGFGSDGINLFLDGSLITAPAIDVPISTYATDTGAWHNIAGSTYYGTSYPDSWHGYIDDVAVWDRVLSYCEILQIAYSGKLFSAGTITGSDSVCEGETANLTAVGSVSAGIWTSTNPSIATVSSTGTVSAIAPGIDTIVFTVVDVCGSDTAIFPITVLSHTACLVKTRNTPSTPNFLSIYPNPNQGSFTIRLSAAYTEDITATITTALGAQVKQFTFPSNTDTPLQLNIPAGIYFITINTSDGRTIEKLIVN